MTPESWFDWGISYKNNKTNLNKNLVCGISDVFWKKYPYEYLRIHAFLAWIRNNVLQGWKFNQCCIHTLVTRSLWNWTMDFTHEKKGETDRWEKIPSLRLARWKYSFNSIRYSFVCALEYTIDTQTLNPFQQTFTYSFRWEMFNFRFPFGYSNNSTWLLVCFVYFDFTFLIEKFQKGTKCGVLRKEHASLHEKKSIVCTYKCLKNSSFAIEFPLFWSSRRGKGGTFNEKQMYLAIGGNTRSLPMNNRLVIQEGKHCTFAWN